ncbi:DUF5801 repeats-in-toxin domain-containing protein, partial [Zwartia sp.]|uniref:DUF5801 repeats-in-toxin domain-containing protein n=1 Tax=Zwartia sp. TaxID=2978004 RepID=UPI003BB1566A
TSGTLGYAYGADGEGSLSWLTTGAPAGFTYEASGDDLLVKQGTVTVMTLTLDTETGAYSVTQNAPVTHPTGLDENNESLIVSYSVSDADGDVAVGQLVIVVDDDTPVVTENELVILDDEILPGGVPGGIGDISPDTQNTNGTLSHSFGADGAGSISWLSTGAPAGFTYEVSDNNLYIKQSSVTVVTATIDPITGSYSTIQNSNILHPLGSAENDQLFDIAYAVVDADGDSVTGGLTILVNDDTPEGSNNPVAVFDDDALLGGNPGGVGDVSPDTAFTSGQLDYKFGADGGLITWLTSGAPVGFTYESSGTDLLIKQGSTTVMTLSVNPLNGDYSVVQNTSIMHTAGMNENSQNFTVTYHVTDNDGDFALGPLYIVVNDDTPTIIRNNVVQLDDDLMPGGNPGGLGDASPDTVNTTGTLGHLFGADGAGSISWMTTGAPAGFTYEASGVDLLVKQGATTVLTLSVDTLSGAYSVVQNAALIHPTGLDENNQALIISYSVMDADGDAASGQLVVVVNDDTPTVTRNEVVMFDDDALSGGNPNGTGDMNPDIEFASGTVNFSAGADGIGSIEWLNAGSPAGFSYLVNDEVLQVLQGSVNVMTLTLDSLTGEYSVVQNAPIQHENDLNENNFAFIVGYKVLDSDNDSAIGELVIVVNDDTPVVLNVEDLVFANADNPIPGGTSTFSYSIGADSRTSFSALNSDFQMDSLTGQVGLNSITNTSITWMSESATQAEFMLEFDYLPSDYSTDTKHATGSLSFNKVDGTYTVSLSEPIQSYSILTTSEALSYTGYQPESSSTDNTQPAVAVAALSNNVYAQFTGVSEPGGGTGSNNLQAVGVDGNGNTFTNGELITQASTWVTTSNSANGVAGDTIQKGEVLDFDLFSTNPFGFTNTAPTAFANELFLKFDGIGTEDLVVILKLIDTDTSGETTKALIIDNGDILKVGNTITPTYGITLDNNDGAVIIQSNDFNDVGENYLISGAQVLVSTEGLIGSGINFVSDVGELGASTETQSFGAATTDNDVIKISDIGLVTNESATLDLALEITLAVKDTDADVSDTQQLGIVVASAPETLMDLAAHSGSMGLVEHLT